MPKAPKISYKEDQLQAAIADVQDRGISVGSAAKAHGVPRSTIQFRLSPAFKKCSLGPPTVLTPEEETTLVRWLLDCSRKGFPKTSLELCLSVQEFLRENPRQNPFVDDYPGKGWLKAFFKRHPELANRKPEAVSHASACVAERDIRGWFSTIEDMLKEQDLFEIVKDPSRIFNGDETSFLLCPQKNQVIAAKGAHNVYDVDVGEAKAAITVMFSFSADGKMVPPMLVYPYQRIPAEVAKLVPKTWLIGRSESGWMTSESFYEYIGNGFNSYITINNVEKPVILFVDGHKTHLTRQVSQLCSDLSIILIALYPNSTRILQPADVGLFFPIKSAWKVAVTNWRKEHPLESVTKKDVAPILAGILNKKDFTASCVSGFKATGLFPWDANNIDFSKCLGKEKKDLPSCVEKVDSQMEMTNMSTKFLSFERFCSIIGEERIKLFKAMQEQGAKPEDDNVLYRLWMEFHDTTHTQQTPESSSNVTEPDVSVHNVSTNSETPPADDTVLVSSPPILDNPQPSTSSAASANGASKVLEHHLHWPESPKRKGRRNVERMPFVISSDKYQEILTEKAEKKAAENAAKEERKRRREEAKHLKEEQKRLKTTEAAKQVSKSTRSNPKRGAKQPPKSNR